MISLQLLFMHFPYAPSNFMTLKNNVNARLKFADTFAQFFYLPLKKVKYAIDLFQLWLLYLKMFFEYKASHYLIEMRNGLFMRC